jgi:hypothetical protein
MTWYVKWQTSPNDPVHSFLCDTPRQVMEVLVHQRSRNRTTWIEDIEGQRIDDAVFQ